MSGTLITQNIQGPASGSNANKIIVPSGHTLDASEGFTPPAGHVVQTIYNQGTADNVQVTNSNFTNLGKDLTITPTSTSSLIYLQANFTVYQQKTAGALDGFGLRWYRDSTAIGGGTAGSAHDMMFYGDEAQPHVRVHFTYIDSPSSTSQITYKLHGRAYTSATVSFFNSYHATYTFSAQEIAG